MIQRDVDVQASYVRRAHLRQEKLGNPAADQDHVVAVFA